MRDMLSLPDRLVIASKVRVIKIISTKAEYVATKYIAFFKHVYKAFVSESISTAVPGSKK